MPNRQTRLSRMKFATVAPLSFQRRSLDPFYNTTLRWWINTTDQIEELCIKWLGIDKLCNSTAGAWIVLLFGIFVMPSKESYISFYNKPIVNPNCELFKEHEAPFIFPTHSYMNFLKNSCHLISYKKL